MKSKFFINIIGKTIFFLCILLLIIDNFTNIKISFYYYFFQFWGTYLISFIFLILTSNKKKYVTILGIIPLIIYCNVFLKNTQIEMRKNIQNTKYEIITNMNGYRLVRKYYLLEKEIAKKKSKIFFNPNSKIGIINYYDFDVKILNNTIMIILDINTTKNGRTIDSLIKSK